MESTELASLFEPFHLSQNFNCRDFSALCSSLVFLCTSRCSPGALLQSIFAGRGRGDNFSCTSVRCAFFCISAGCAFLCTSAGCALFVHFCWVSSFCISADCAFFVHFCCRVCTSDNSWRCSLARLGAVTSADIIESRKKSPKENFSVTKK